MSLDVYLTTEETRTIEPEIYLRENGEVRTISREEWNKRYPDRQPVVAEIELETNEVYSRNITHNLGRMAGEAGQLYEAMWRPDEQGWTKAAQLIEPLRYGLGLLKANPDKFKALNPSNGWGSYDGLVNFAEEYLAACEANPSADVHVSR